MAELSEKSVGLGPGLDNKVLFTSLLNSLTDNGSDDDFLINRVLSRGRNVESD